MRVNRIICCGYFICLLLSGIIHQAWAQYETANWIFKDFTMNFIPENPDFTASMVNNSEGEYASYSSDRGELLIFTDGSTVWNGNGLIMKNGQNITPYRTKSIIIPKPGSPDQFYIFSYNAFNVPGNNNNTFSVVVYAIVDLSLNNGQGEVVKKNQVLYNNMHGTFTISGKCDRSVFWLVGEVDTNLTEGSDKIYIFQIDKDGITGPFISVPLTIGMGSNFRLSPDASKLLFTVTGNSGSATVLADFKPENLPDDPIENVRWLPATGPGEFSPQSKFVYVVNGNSITQYDIQTGKIFEFFPDIKFLGVPQQAPDGKIYIPVDGVKKLMVINQPDQAACGFSESGITIPAEAFVLPTFASNLFYRGPFTADAGSDKTICQDEMVLLGNPQNNATSFKWEPKIFLDDAEKVQPVFQYTGTDAGWNTFIYRLTAFFEGCSQSDFVVVKLNPKTPPPVIEGTRSVCPGAVNVPYWSDAVNKAGYSWRVNGGIINGEADKDTVRINWGQVSSGSSVELQVIDANGCLSETALLEVVIDDKLHPQTPYGLDSVCVNLPDQHRYEITFTPGSTYAWGISGGEIIKEDKSAVIVNWKKSTGRIWVNEKSVTNEAVCVGTSDTLKVNVFKDPADIHLDFVTVDSVDETTIHLQASSSFVDRIKEYDVLYRLEDEENWSRMDSFLYGSVLKASQSNFRTDEFVYQFKVNMINRCDEEVSSKIHNSIRLTAAGNEESSTIDLSWNSYDFGTDDKIKYEVFKFLDPGKEKYTVTGMEADTIAVVTAGESFQYLLRIKAVSSDGLFTSLSNEVSLNFNYELVIPNVITPNDDGFNDTFEIKNIKLYPQNKLIIVNRYGKTIFEQAGYQGGWTAKDESAGVYYFTLLLPEKEMEYKGWLQIIR